MRKLAVLIALVAIAAIPAIAADNYHYLSNMNCSDCHSMHASAHDNLNAGAAITTPKTPVNPLTVNPYYPGTNPGAGRESLLKADDVCETCHKDQVFAPDVYGDNVNGYKRSAGGIRENATGGGHRIGSIVPAPGYKSDVVDVFPAGSELECVSCHSPHGANAFRNLIGHGQTAPPSGKGVSTTYAQPTVAKAAAFDNTKDVTILNASYTPTGDASKFASYYGQDVVVFSRVADGLEYNYNGAKSSNRIDQFCGMCHGAFHGGGPARGGSGSDTTVSDGTAFVRHPTSQVKASFSSATAASNLRLYQTNAAQTSGSDSPGCLTCHKAHGNNNPFALIYPDAKGAAKADLNSASGSEEGTGAFKTLCKSCHGMGGSITAY